MRTPEPIHPGAHLAEIIEELGITPYRLAKAIGVPHDTTSLDQPRSGAPAFGVVYCAGVEAVLI